MYCIMGSGCALFKNVLQGTEQAKRHVGTQQNCLCLSTREKRVRYHQREAKKRLVVFAIFIICIIVMTNTEPIPIMADVFAGICKQSTVNSHLAYKQRVKKWKVQGEELYKYI